MFCWLPTDYVFCFRATRKISEQFPELLIQRSWFLRKLKKTYVQFIWNVSSNLRISLKEFRSLKWGVQLLVEQGSKVVLMLQLQELSFILQLSIHSYVSGLSELPMLTDFLKLDPADLPESTSSEFWEDGTQELRVVHDSSGNEATDEYQPW